VPTRQARAERLEPGVCFTIEPMINGGTKDSVLDRTDGWTVRTRDGRVSAQFEHTILMGEERPEILTVTKLGPQPGFLF
jgi:methionyl aminopeptidase